MINVGHSKLICPRKSKVILIKIDWKIEKVKLFLSIPIVFMDHYEKSLIFHNAIKID